jgi:hypothetical protein
MSVLSRQVAQESGEADGNHLGYCPALALAVRGHRNGKGA